MDNLLIIYIWIDMFPRKKTHRAGAPGASERSSQSHGGTSPVGRSEARGALSSGHLRQLRHLVLVLNMCWLVCYEGKKESRLWGPNHHKPSPSHHQFDSWDVYHSQSWVVYGCYTHMK